jgi:DegV family protein with EDD domain
MLVTLDGRTYREHSELSSGDFYERLSTGASVSTSQPAPGAFLDVYERAAAAGAARILSIHIGSALSGTLNSARIAAQMSPVPVDLIDTGQASFLEGLCVWEACEALAAGSTIEQAANAARRASDTVGNIFVVRGTELLRRGGRLNMEDIPGATVPVLALLEGAVRPVGTVSSLDEAVDEMARHLETAMADSPEKRFRVGVADGAAGDLLPALEARVREIPGVGEVIRYEIGPSLGAHTGPGCTGLSFLGRPV